MNEDKRMTRAEAATHLGVSVGTVDRYVREGLLTRDLNRITRRSTFSATEVRELRRQREGLS